MVADLQKRQPKQLAEGANRAAIFNPFSAYGAGTKRQCRAFRSIQIQGNSEEPKVMFITPWREPPGTGRLYDGATQFQDQWLYSLDKDRLDFEVKMLDTYKRAEPKP